MYMVWVFYYDSDEVYINHAEKYDNEWIKRPMEILHIAEGTSSSKFSRGSLYSWFNNQKILTHKY